MSTQEIKYGLPLETWEQLTPEQQEGFANVFALANPLKALNDGMTQILEGEKLSLNFTREDSPSTE